MKDYTRSFELPRAGAKLLAVAMVVGLAITVGGLFVAPDRIWPNLLIAVFYVLSLALGAGFFVAVLHVFNSGWGTAIRRVPEAIMRTLPVAAVGAGLLIFGIHTLYEWSHDLVVAADPILSAKKVWLNEPFFIARLAGYFVLWLVLSRLLIRHSESQDDDGDLRHTRLNVRYSVLFLILGVISFSFASFDLLMSLQPHWYSTVFGLLTLSGAFLGGLAITTVMVILLRKQGYGHIYTSQHLLDLGRLIMSFSVFWIYMWVSQHMLIWYSNIPEETSYYFFRHFGGWGSLSFLNVMLNWLVPFLILLPRRTKMNDKVLLQAAIVVLVGRWLDLFIMVMPAALGARPTLGVWEIGPFLGLLACFFWFCFRALRKQPHPLPIQDPYLVESLHA